MMIMLSLSSSFAADDPVGSNGHGEVPTACPEGVDPSRPAAGDVKQNTGDDVIDDDNTDAVIDADG